MSLEHILLGMLKEPCSGYELGQEFEQGPAHYWHARLSQIYPTLKRMEGKGWLESRTEPPDRGPERVVYSRTGKGRRALEAWLSSGPRVRRERLEYLAQLRYLHELDDPGKTAAFMRDLRTELVEWLADLHAIEHKLLDESGGWLAADENTFHAISSVRMGIHSLGAKASWCEETLERIEARRNRGLDCTAPGHDRSHPC